MRGLCACYCVAMFANIKNLFTAKPVTKQASPPQDPRGFLINRFDEAPKSSLSRAEMTEILGGEERASVLMAPAMWIGRAVASLPLVAKLGETMVANHPALALMPTALRFRLALDLAVYGNAYCEIIRQENAAPVGLRYINPLWITLYGVDEVNSAEVRYPQGRRNANDSTGRTRTKTVLARDLFHARIGIDPEAQFTGISPLIVALREASTDVEAANAAMILLVNLGIPGAILSPEQEGTMDEKEAELIQERFDRRFTRRGRGKTSVMTEPMRLQQFDVDFVKMGAEAIRSMSEVRIAALMGVPAAVVGFGRGVDQTSVGATLRELRAMAYENAALPNLGLLLEEFNRIVSPEYADNLMVDYDLPSGHVAAMETSARAKLLFEAGIVTRAEARQMAGFDFTEADNVFFTATQGTDTGGIVDE